MGQRISVSNVDSQDIGISNSSVQSVNLSNSYSYSVSMEHNSMLNRNADNCHPISAITGLSSAISSFSDSIITSGKFENGTFSFLNSNGEACFSISMPVYDGGAE